MAPGVAQDTALEGRHAGIEARERARQRRRLGVCVGVRVTERDQGRSVDGVEQTQVTPADPQPPVAGQAHPAAVVVGDLGARRHVVAQDGAVQERAQPVEDGREVAGDVLVAQQQGVWPRPWAPGRDVRRPGALREATGGDGPKRASPARELGQTRRGGAAVAQDVDGGSGVARRPVGLDQQRLVGRELERRRADVEMAGVALESTVSPKVVGVETGGRQAEAVIEHTAQERVAAARVGGEPDPRAWWHGRGWCRDGCAPGPVRGRSVVAGAAHGRFGSKRAGWQYTKPSGCCHGDGCR